MKTEDMAKQLEEAIADYIEKNGWQKFKDVALAGLGFVLVSKEGDEEVYESPSGVRATIRPVTEH